MVKNERLRYLDRRVCEDASEIVILARIGLMTRCEVSLTVTVHEAR